MTFEEQQAYWAAKHEEVRKREAETAAKWVRQAGAIELEEYARAIMAEMQRREKLNEMMGIER